MLSNSNKGVFSVYVDLDCFVDVRRSILQRLIGDMDFAKTFPNYYKRKMDSFATPSLPFTDEQFKEAYENRNLSDLSGVIETPLMSKLLIILLNVDKLVGKPISINKVNITVNLNHYDGFDDELCREFTAALTRGMRFNHQVDFVNVPAFKQTSTFFKSFSHVFKYDLLLSKDYLKLFESLEKTPIPDTKFIVPPLMLKENAVLQNSPEEMILASSVVVSSFLKLIPWDIKLFCSV